MSTVNLARSTTPKRAKFALQFRKVYDTFCISREPRFSLAFQQQLNYVLGTGRSFYNLFHFIMNNKPWFTILTSYIRTYA